MNKRFFFVLFIIFIPKFLFASNAFWVWAVEYPWVYSSLKSDWMYLNPTSEVLIHEDDKWAKLDLSESNELGWIWVKEFPFAYSYKQSKWIYFVNGSIDTTYIFSKGEPWKKFSEIFFPILDLNIEGFSYPWGDWGKGVAYNDYLINSGHFTWLKDIQYFEDDYGIERSVFFKDANTSNLQNIITLSSIISSDDNISKLNDLKNLEHLDLHLQSNNVGDLNWNLNFLKSIKSDKIVSLKLTFNGNDSFLMPDENGTLVQYKGKSYSFNDNNGSRIINVVDELNNESNLTVDDFDTYTRVDYFNLEGISHFKNLKTLHLVQSWQVRDFSPISTLSNLSNLFIEVDSEALGVDPLSPNRYFRQAKNIDKVLDDLPNLKYLQIYDEGYSNEQTYFDEEYLIGLKNLETLIMALPYDYANNVATKADEFANILSTLPSLKNLQLEPSLFYVSDTLNLDDSFYLKTNGMRYLDDRLDPEKYFNYTLPHINFSIIDYIGIKIPFP